MLKQLIAALPLLGTIAVHAAPMGEPSVQEAMIQDIDAVKYHMSIQYAPKEWKFEHFGWDLESAADKAKQTITQEEPQTAKEFQKIFKSFLNSTQDYHVNSLYYSTEWAFFPLGAKKAGNKYYLTNDVQLNFSLEDILFLTDESFDELEQYETALSNFAPGDELVAIDGISPSEIVETIIDEQLGGNRTPTGYALAERALFFRMGKYGHDVPSGTFQLTVRHQGVSFPKTYRFSWIHVPEWVMNKSHAKGDLGGNSPAAIMERYMKKDFTAHYAEELLYPRKNLSKAGTLFTKGEDDEEFDEDAREKGSLPPLGEILWESPTDKSLYAYLYKSSKGQKIGYIYLPSFSYAGYDADEMLEEIIQTLTFFKKESAALVLDITNNPGGNLFYTYGVLSTLTNTPLIVPTNREILIQEDVYRAALIYKFMEFEENSNDAEDDTLSGYPFNLEVLGKIKSYCQSIISFWEEGKTFTDPIYLFGIDKINPHPEVQYDKPILLLINELDFSCADFFPAILQDNGRATLFGKGTAGAGGYVRGYQHSSRFGIMGYTLTGSIAYRPNGNPIENLGVQPDVSYEITAQDMTSNFADYIQAVDSQLQKMVK